MEALMNKHAPPSSVDGEIELSVFSNGRSRAVRIPKEFEFPGKRVIMIKQPDGSLLLRTAETAGLIDYLKTAEPWLGGDFLDRDDEELGPLDEVEL
jgi:antitoxin VapB